jgi:hypothetical protein
MNSNRDPIFTLAWTFGLMSLFAVGGANSAIPEMHRVAVDVPLARDAPGGAGSAFDRLDGR